MTSPTKTPPKLTINWDAVDESATITQPRNHLEETLDEIHEMSALIDNALGISSSSTLSHVSQQIKSPATEGLSYSPTKLTDMLCIKVIQLQTLLNISKDMHLYVSFDWEVLGRASTHALRPPKHIYNATLRFRSPLPHGSSLQDALLNSPPLMIELFSRNENSSSDICLGRKFIEDLSLFDIRRQPLHIQLLDGKTNVVGVIDIEIVIM